MEGVKMGWEHFIMGYPLHPLPPTTHIPWAGVSAAWPSRPHVVPVAQGWEKSLNIHKSLWSFVIFLTGFLAAEFFFYKPLVLFGFGFKLEYSNLIRIWQVIIPSLLQSLCISEITLFSPSSGWDGLLTCCNFAVQHFQAHLKWITYCMCHRTFIPVLSLDPQNMPVRIFRS